PISDELRAAARREPWLLSPTTQMRTLRELEPPALDEGFAAVEEVDFVRALSGVGAGGVLVAAAALERPAWREAVAAADPAAPHLVFAWAPDGGDAAVDAATLLRDVVSGPVEHAACVHPGGPPRCWCRPP